MKAIRIVRYLISMVRSVFTRSNNSAPICEFHGSLDQARSLAMNASVQAKRQRIEASTGMSKEYLTNAILKNHNIQLRKEVSSYE